MISDREYQQAVEYAFGWLLSAGFQATVHSYDNLGNQAVLTDHRRWLALAWEARENEILPSRGYWLPPGQFNDDPLRNPRPIEELLPGRTRHEIDAAGAVVGEDGVRVALRRLSEVIREEGTLQG